MDDGGCRPTRLYTAGLEADAHQAVRQHAIAAHFRRRPESTGGWIEEAERVIRLIPVNQDQRPVLAAQTQLNVLELPPGTGWHRPAHGDVCRLSDGSLE